MTARAPWFDEWPERLEQELADLREAGATYEVDDDARAKGVLRLPSVRWPYDGDQLDLTVEFPDLYPFLRPEIGAPTLHLPRHQAPGVGYLCLVNRDTRNWDVDETVAGYLAKRLHMTILAATTPSNREAEDLEEHQGEPLTDFLPYDTPSMVLVDGNWTIPEGVTRGDLLIGLDPHLSARGGLLRGAVLEIRDPRGRAVAKAHPGFERLFPLRLAAPWARIHDVPFDTDAGTIVAKMMKTATLSFPTPQPCGDSRIALAGFLFREEVSYRHKADSWLFALQVT